MSGPQVVQLMLNLMIKISSVPMWLSSNYHGKLVTITTFTQIKNPFKNFNSVPPGPQQIRVLQKLRRNFLKRKREKNSEQEHKSSNNAWPDRFVMLMFSPPLLLLPPFHLHHTIIPSKWCFARRYSKSTIFYKILFSSFIIIVRALEPAMEWI